MSSEQHDEHLQGMYCSRLRCIVVMGGGSYSCFFFKLFNDTRSVLFPESEVGNMKLSDNFMDEVK